ncbi:MAG: hypothetical protein OEL78_07300 [Hyphomicrobiales bacterium]|nr:hypothetical protein [Hyphomicrobiales bacterium]
MDRKQIAALIAAAVIIAALLALMLAMPKIMALVSGAGPLGGIALAVAVMLGFVGIFWLRSRAQNKPHENGD